MKALLIDDERKSLSILRYKIEKVCKNVTIVGETQSPEEGIKLIGDLRPDLVFLDIAMPNMSGFSLLSKMKDPSFEVIFVTAFDGYAIDAINNCAIGYLLKPFNNDDLVCAVQRAEKSILKKNTHIKNRALIKNLETPISKNNSIAVPFQDGLEFIKINSIIHCQGENGYTKLFLTNKKSILSSYSIGYFSKQLVHLGFYLVHKSHLINLEHISKFLNEGFVVLTDNSRLPVSRNKKLDFLNTIK